VSPNDVEIGAIVITGAELESMTPADLDRALDFDQVHTHSLHTHLGQPWHVCAH